MQPASRFLATACFLAACCPLSASDAQTTAPAAAATPATAAAPVWKAVPIPATAQDAPPPSSDPAKPKTAGELWQYIHDWANKDPGIDPGLDDAARKEAVSQFLDAERTRLNPACKEFLASFPQDPRRWDVRLIQLFLQPEGDGSEMPAMERTLNEVAAASDASPEVRQKARQTLLGMHLESLSVDGLTPALDAEISAFEKDFPQDPDGWQFVMLRMRALGDDAPPEQTKELLAKLVKSPNLAAAAAARQQLALRTEPLDLKFTAVDGRQVDLSALRGKVVLVDFWATWCPECLAEVPAEVAAYKKYHPKGFEIVGVSLDEDRAILEKFTRVKELPWPQYFDGKHWQNEIAQRFNVNALPAMWLVGTDGRIVNFSARADLDGAIAALLDKNAVAVLPAAGMAAVTSNPSAPGSQP